MYVCVGWGGEYVNDTELVHTKVKARVAMHWSCMFHLHVCARGVGWGGYVHDTELMEKGGMCSLMSRDCVSRKQTGGGGHERACLLQFMMKDIK
jgi:hypothetical protein